MEHLTRHLVSQHFGRVVAQVEIDENGHGIVHLFLERPHHLAIGFTFASGTAGRIFGSATCWKEMVLRLAVSQAHKLHLREQINIGWRAEPLNLEGPAWVGDLRLAPYGGATIGLDPDFRAARSDGLEGAQSWPGFDERLKTALREAGHNPGPRTLAREFNPRSAAAQINARTARQWLSGLAAPSPDELHALASWLGVAADWLRCGDGAPAQEEKSRRSDRLSASLVDQAIELQRANGDLSAAAFLGKRAISDHIILRVLACAAFRRKPRCVDPNAIGAAQRDHSDAQ